MRKDWLAAVTLALCAAAGAQEPGGWRRLDAPRSDAEAPAELVLAAGTWITIRVNETLSSDHNRAGEAFTATLAQPLIVDGWVVSRRGQTVGGRVAEARKAGRVKGTSRLGIELTEIGLADGQQVPVRTQLIEYAGGTSQGRDAAAVGTAVGVGAAVGAAADGGFGAGIGAIAGAAASTIGVLATRGRATEVFPETALTFRILDPVTISTGRSAQAFQPARQEDYEQKQLEHRASQRPAPGPPWSYYGGYFGYFPYYQGFIAAIF